MSVLSDKEIRERSLDGGMIVPFVEELIRRTANDKVLSYGLSSYGYDVRVSNEFKIFTNINSSIIDPKKFSNDNFVSKTIADNECLILPPNSFALANTIETFKVPRDILIIYSLTTLYLPKTKILSPSIFTTDFSLTIKHTFLSLLSLISIFEPASMVKILFLCFGNTTTSPYLLLFVLNSLHSNLLSLSNGLSMNMAVIV